MAEQIKFVTGKGGVGKTTIAVSFARQFALAGKKCLLVELEGSSGLEQNLGVELSQKPKQLPDGFWAARYEALPTLKELVRHYTKSETLSRLFLSPPVMRDFLVSAPGLKELALLGKITSSVRKFGPAMDFDVIVVDAFSTGHLLALLDAPAGMGQAFNFGPMGEQSRSMVEAVQNQQITEFIVVGLSRKLVHQETQEFMEQLHERKLKTSFLLNQYIDISKTEIAAENKSLKCLDDLEQKIERQNAIKKMTAPSYLGQYTDQKIVELVNV